MSAAVIAASEPLDLSAIQAIMIRWKLAEQHLADTPEVVDAGKLALHVLVARDLPTLLREVMRLRPDLSIRPDPTDLMPTEH